MLIINDILKEFVNYDNLKLMPRDKYNNLLQQNKKIIDEINIMKIKLQTNPNLYSAAEIDYKKITKKIDIPFLRRLMHEQQININNDNVLIDFSIEDNNVNLVQNILLTKLINQRKMHNLIKFFVLKKYCSKLNTEEVNKSKIKSESKPKPKPKSDSPPPPPTPPHTPPHTPSVNTIRKKLEEVNAVNVRLQTQIDRISKEKRVGELELINKQQEIEEEKKNLQIELQALLQDKSTSNNLSSKINDFEKQLETNVKELGKKNADFDKLQEEFIKKITSLREAECLQESSNLKISSLEGETRELEKLREESVMLQGAIDAYERTFDIKKGELEENELELNRQAESIALLQAELAKTTHQSKQLQDELVKRTSENLIFMQEQKRLQEVEKIRQEQLMQIQIQQRQQIEKQEQTLQQLEQLQQQQQIQEEQQQLQQQQQLQLLQRQIDDQTKKIDDQTQQIASQQENSKKQEQELNAKISKLNSEYTKTSQALALRLAENQALKGRYEELTKELAKTQELLRQQKSENASLVEKTKKQEQDIQAAHLEISSTRQQLDSLEQKRKDREVYIDRLQQTLISLGKAEEQRRTNFVIEQQKLNRQIDSLSEQNRKKDMQLEQLVQENQEKDRQLELVLQERDDIKRRYDNEVKRASFLEEKITKLLKKLNDARKLLAEEKEKNARFVFEEQKKAKDIEEGYNKSIQDLEEKVRQLQLQQKADLTEEQRKRFAQRIDELNKSRTSLEEQLSSMTRERDDLLEEMKRKTNERQEEVDELLWQIDAITLDLQAEQDANFHLQAANFDLQTRITTLTDLTARLSDQLAETSRINEEQNSVIQEQTQQLEVSLERERMLNLRLENSWEAWIRSGVDTVVSVPGRVVDTVADLARQGMDAVRGGKGYTEEDNKYYKKYLKYKKKYLEVK